MEYSFIGVGCEKLLAHWHHDEEAGGQRGRNEGKKESVRGLELETGEVVGSFNGSEPGGLESTDKKVKEREADIPWFTQKAKKAPGTGLAQFMEASGSLSMRWRHTAPSQEGLRSLGRKVNSEGFCAPKK